MWNTEAIAIGIASRKFKNGTAGKESGSSMDALTIVWQLGQSLSLFGLAAGAVLAFLTDEPYYGRHKNRPNRPCPRPEAHAPMNHRLLLEAEW